MSQALIVFRTPATKFVNHMEVEEEADDQDSNTKPESRMESEAGQSSNTSPQATEYTLTKNDGADLTITTSSDALEEPAGTPEPPTVVPVSFSAAGAAYCQAVFSGINAERRRIQQDIGRPESDATWSDDLTAGAQAFSLVSPRFLPQNLL